MTERLHLTLDREDVEWLQRVIAAAKHETENPLVESAVAHALTDSRRTLHFTHIWPLHPTDDELSTVYENNGVTFNDTMQALLDVTESLMVEATGVDFDGMRTPLSPVLSADDRDHLVFLNARLALVHQIMNRPPTRATVTS